MISRFVSVSFLCLIATLCMVEAQPGGPDCRPRPRRSPNPACSVDPTPSPSSGDSSCSLSIRQGEINDLRAVFIDAINNNVNLLPAFVRAAFHDCITATPDKPNSGCNGSLRLAEELNNAGNNRLQNALTAIEDAVAGLSCTSVADAIQVASAVALSIAGGPDVIDDVVSADSPRVDVDEADTVDGELPSSTSGFDELVEFYERKGLTSQDLISSSAGAHSLGGFQNPPNGIASFTTDRFSVSSGYAHNLVQRRQSGENLGGFNTLISDVALISNIQSVQKMREYAGCAPGMGVCERNDVAGTPVLNEEFKIFLVKLSRMSGVTVGDSSVLSQGL